MARQTMPTRAVGHTWEPRSRAFPSLVQAMESRREHVGLSAGIRFDTWVLDYSFAPAGLCRVLEESAAWMPRDAGVGHLYAPGITYWEDSRSVEQIIDSVYVRFHCEHPELEGLVEDGGGFCRLLDPQGRLGELLRDAARAGARLGEAGYWKAGAALLSILHLLLRSRPSGPRTRTTGSPDPPAGSPELVFEVREYLLAHLDERVTLGALAEHAHVSVSTLSHRYRAETGETPMATLTRMRLAAAKEMLIRGQRLKNVALQTGFCDEYHFSKTFKRVEGVAPIAWARKRG